MLRALPKKQRWAPKERGPESCLTLPVSAPATAPFPVGGLRKKFVQLAISRNNGTPIWTYKYCSPFFIIWESLTAGPLYCEIPSLAFGFFFGPPVLNVYLGLCLPTILFPKQQARWDETDNLVWFIRELPMRPSKRCSRGNSLNPFVSRMEAVTCVAISGVAVKELNLRCYIVEALLFTIYTYPL